MSATVIPASWHLSYALPGDWTADAACTPLTANLFFSETAADQRHARMICVRCPVRPQCAEWSDRYHPHGMWAGTFRSG